MIQPGTVVADYRIEGLLGYGGMGVVYEATQLTLDRTVALKVLEPNLADDSAFRERFRREGMLQAKLEHPNIVTVYEAGLEGDTVFLAMRLVRGQTLKDLIVARGIDPARALRLLEPVADALDAAHERELIHRDVKPQNILVAGGDHPYLADFGLTKAPGDRSLTQSGQFVGSLDYVSPETIRDRPLTTRSDVYSLAAVLFECLTGVVPYHGESDAAVLYAHTFEEPPSVTERRPGLPERLDDVIRRGMAKDPQDRFASASDLVRAAREAFDRKTRTAMAPPGPFESAREAGIRDPEGRVATQPSADESSRLATALLEPTEPSNGESPTTTRPESSIDVGTNGRTVAEPTRRRSVPETAGKATVVTDPATAGATRGGRSRFAGALALAASLAGVGGFLLAAGVDDGNGARAGERVKAGSISIEMPRGWERTTERGEVASVPGVRFDDSLQIAPRGAAARQRVIVGQVKPTGPGLLASGLVERLGREPRRDDRVTLGESPALRHRGLEPAGYAPELTIYTVPTTLGAATIACVAKGGLSSEFMEECGSIAAGMRLAGTEVFALGPGAGYVSGVNAAVETLRGVRDKQAWRLRDAETAAGQARAARAIALAYADARRRVGEGTVPPQTRDAHDRLLSALATARDGYSAMARSGGDRRDYLSGSRTASSGERGVTKALERIGAAG